MVLALESPFPRPYSLKRIFEALTLLPFFLPASPKASSLSCLHVSGVSCTFPCVPTHLFPHLSSPDVCFSLPVTIYLSVVPLSLSRQVSVFLSFLPAEGSGGWGG